MVWFEKAAQKMSNWMIITYYNCIIKIIAEFGLDDWMIMTFDFGKYCISRVLAAGKNQGVMVVLKHPSTASAFFFVVPQVVTVINSGTMSELP